jgi:hypothetical protein
MPLKQESNGNYASAKAGLLLAAPVMSRHFANWQCFC